MSRMLIFHQYKNHGSGQILHTGSWNHCIQKCTLSIWWILLHLCLLACLSAELASPLMGHEHDSCHFRWGLICLANLPRCSLLMLALQNIKVFLFSPRCCQVMKVFASCAAPPGESETSLQRRKVTNAVYQSQGNRFASQDRWIQLIFSTDRQFDKSGQSQQTLTFC